MEKRFIQTAAPEAGLYMECGSDKSDFAKWNDEFRGIGKGRMAFQSTWHEEVVIAGRVQLGQKLRTATYVRPKA